ncbi:MAG TPA: DUF885 family protein, partial [Acidobacteriota bacterium]|nr:DUF885 family protein [Acidobacteriota bacterium]
MRFRLLAIVIVAAGFSALVLSQPDNAEDLKFEKLMDDYLQKLWQRSPLLATFSGIHQYDDRIQPFSLEEARSSLEQNKKLAARFQKEMDRSKLGEQFRIDYDLLMMGVRQEEFSLLQSRGLERDPGTYPQIVAGVGFLMFTREYAPFNDRMKNLAIRMEKMPEILEEGKKNVKNPPKLLTNIAIETTKGAIQLYEKVIGPGAKQLPEDNAVGAHLEAANTKLVAALRSYQEFLEKDLLQRSNGNFADGRENFVYRLKNFYLLDETPEQIKATAEKVLIETKTQMDTLARKMDTGRPWWEILEEAKKKHFSAEAVLPEYRKMTDRARRWVIEKKLATIPEEQLDVIETPPFMRYVVPYAAYFPPAPFEKEQKGFYFVTPVEADTPA